MSAELTDWFLDEANELDAYKSESAADESNIIKSTINIACYNLNSNLLMIGTGLIIDPSGYIITNKHVTADSDICNVYYSKEIGIGANVSIGQKAFRVSESDSSDLALFKIDGYNRNKYVDLSKSTNRIQNKMNAIYYGYPSKQENSQNINDYLLTSINGPVTNNSGTGFFSVSAYASQGASGSGVFSNNGQFLGILYSGVPGDDPKIGVIFRYKIKNFLIEILNNNKLVGSIYTAENLKEDIYVPINNSLKQNLVQESNPVNLNKKNNINNSVIKVDSNFSKKIAGKIYLQIESSGEAWYVDSRSYKRFYMKDGDDAFKILKSLGAGINEKDLLKVPVGYSKSIYESLIDSDRDGLPDSLEKAIGTNINSQDSDKDGHDDVTEIIKGYRPDIFGEKVKTDSSLIKRLGNGIYLQTVGKNAKGQAWLIKDGLRYYLDPLNAYNAMRYLGIGITNINLEKVEISKE